MPTIGAQAHFSHFIYYTESCFVAHIPVKLSAIANCGSFSTLKSAWPLGSLSTYGSSGNLLPHPLPQASRAQGLPFPSPSFSFLYNLSHLGQSSLGPLLLALSWLALGLLVLASSPLSLSPSPILPPLMARFSLNASRCLWVNPPPSYLPSTIPFSSVITRSGHILNYIPTPSSAGPSELGAYRDSAGTLPWTSVAPRWK